MLSRILQLFKFNLTQLVGNKVYMRDIESLLKKMESLDITPQEQQALDHLNRDLAQAKIKMNKKRLNCYQINKKCIYYENIFNRDSLVHHY